MPPAHLARGRGRTPQVAVGGTLGRSSASAGGLLACLPDGKGRPRAGLRHIAKAVAPHPRLRLSVTEDRAPVLSAVPMDDEVWCISMDHGGGVLSAGREFGIRRQTLRGGTRGIGYFVTHGFSFYRYGEWPICNL